MHQVLLYSVIFVSCISFLLALIACARVGKVINSTKGLEWEDVANLTGDIASVKKTIQTLNNRLNGMHSPKAAEQELMLQLLQQQQKAPVKQNGIGG